MEILLVEDSPTDRLMAVEALESAKLLNKLNVVENGEEAMAYLRREGEYRDAKRPALILLDLNMPKKDGREVLAEIKSDPDLKYIPVVILTTSAAEEDVVRAYGDHANSYITKPVNFTRFTDAIASLGHYWLEMVTLPPEHPTPAKPVPQVRRETQRTFRVLMVEDNPVDVLFLEDALETSSLGQFHLRHVSRVSDLAAVLKAGQFDIIITDLGLPDVQGLDSFRKIRDLAPDLPIIVLTGDSDESAGIASLREGAQDYLVKGELSGRAVARAIRYAVDKRNIEDQLRHSQRMEIIGRLAGGIAHDFNNLLTVIEGHAGLLAGDESGVDDRRESTTAILEATERAASLTRQLLTFSHRQQISLKLLDLNSVVEIFSKVLSRALGAQIEMQISLHPSPLVLLGDLGMIEQVLLNLAVNARDAMPTGGTLIFKTSAKTLGLGETVPQSESYTRNFACLEVTDSGQGIPEANIPHLFEPFFTTKLPGTGTGLGLATVHSIVKQQGGRIEVRSKLNQGTSFEVLLPLTSGVPESLETVPTALETTTPEALGEKTTILLVEDEAPVRRLVTRFLEKRGYTIVAAASGVEALALFENHKQEIDLLLTDMIMPGGVSGRQLGEELTRRLPGLPIVYCSGYSDDLSSPDFHLEEGSNFLQKPFKLQDLQRTIQAQLSESD